jgi:hypothetical protein
VYEPLISAMVSSHFGTLAVTRNVSGLVSFARNPIWLPFRAYSMRLEVPGSVHMNSISEGSSGGARSGSSATVALISWPVLPAPCAGS